MELVKLILALLTLLLGHLLALGHASRVQILWATHRSSHGVEMTPEQGKQMDRVSFPPSILNMNGTSMQVPSNIKSWGQLIRGS
jgi:hypothetical protein